jgi:CheY-like chemotaxis protein
MAVVEEKIILMADNQREFLAARCEFLEQAGYTVITAHNPTDAERILERGSVDLAILDIRMTDDDDQEDTSGLEVARKFGQKVPIIMLTGYPTWENVKEMLGRNIDGISPAVDFLAKDEEPDLMVQAVNLTLAHPQLKENMLLEFRAESSQALHEALKEKTPADTADRFQKSLERTERDLLKHRKEISRQSERYQKTAVWMGLVGISVILIGAFMVLFEMIPLGILSGAASVVAEAISVIFINRSAQAAQLVEKDYAELQGIYKASHLISICDTIETKTKREDAKLMIVEKLAGKWFC